MPRATQAAAQVRAPIMVQISAPLLGVEHQMQFLIEPCAKEKLVRQITTCMNNFRDSLNPSGAPQPVLPEAHSDTGAKMRKLQAQLDFAEAKLRAIQDYASPGAVAYTHVMQSEARVGGACTSRVRRRCSRRSRSCPRSQKLTVLPEIEGEDEPATEDKKLTVLPEIEGDEEPATEDKAPVTKGTFSWAASRVRQAVSRAKPSGKVKPFTQVTPHSG
mmetsp:Transcript_93408/g.241472  ORF Transcript_93408/g.241472 Transcript_93408/m.241472 type:complete len:217 (+) Transcript_93408:66-716(+)